jgi:hypothetical protein
LFGFLSLSVVSFFFPFPLFGDCYFLGSDLVGDFIVGYCCLFFGADFTPLILLVCGGDGVSLFLIGRLVRPFYGDADFTGVFVVYLCLVYFGCAFYLDFDIEDAPFGLFLDCGGGSSAETLLVSRAALPALQALI